MAGGFPLSARHELLLNRYCVLRDSVNDALEYPLSVTVESILRAGLTGATSLLPLVAGWAFIWHKLQRGRW